MEAGATVDIWHCDATGEYSDVSDQRLQYGRAELAARLPDHRRARRGALHHDLPGLVLRPRRAHPLQGPHLARRDDGYEFTSQLFFDDAFIDAVHATQPYAQNGTTPDMPNERDSIYQQAGGQTLLAVEPDGDSGYKATIGIALQA